LVKLFGVGNIFLLLPVAKMLKLNYPRALIDLFTLSFNKGIIEHTEDFNKALYIEGSSLCRCARGLIKNMLAIRKNNYDLVLDFDQFANISALCSFFANAFSIGFRTSHARRHLLYACSVPYLENKHMSEIFKTLLRPLNCDSKEENVEFRLETEERRIRGFFNNNGIDLENHFVVIFHPGSSANFTNRRWPAQKFKTLAKKILDYTTVWVILTGNSKDESRLTQDIASSIDSPHVVNASGKFTLEEFIALIKLSNLIVASDTAPIQIASYFHRPCVSFYGPNTPFLYGPKNSNGIIFYKPFPCSPCISNLNSKKSNCRNPRCINSITAEEVFQEIKHNFFSIRK
jgi:ADP-heptose:LPS heptosyltransferase